jgi:hypothetical protein
LYFSSVSVVVKKIVMPSKLISKKSKISHPPDKPKYALICVTLQEMGCPLDSFTACFIRAHDAICAPAD